MKGDNKYCPPSLEGGGPPQFCGGEDVKSLYPRYSAGESNSLYERETACCKGISPCIHFVHLVE